MGVEAAEDGVIEIFFLNLRQDVGLDLICYGHRSTVIQLIDLQGVRRGNPSTWPRAAVQRALASVSTVGAG